MANYAINTFKMKNIIAPLIFSVFVFNSFVSHSQNVDFECEGVTKSKLYDVFNKYKDKGFSFYKNTKFGYIDLTSRYIDELSYQDLKQSCINAWGQLYQDNYKYAYDRFVRMNFYITYDQYIKDIQYLEILSQIHAFFKKQ